jgi:hypothetical protein
VVGVSLWDVWFSGYQHATCGGILENPVQRVVRRNFFWKGAIQDPVGCNFFLVFFG